MKPPPFSYHDPRTVRETVELLGRLENAKLLAGGQSLMPMLNFRFVQPDHIVDLNRVEGLSFIRESNGTLEIGAMTRQRELEFSDLIRTRLPLMQEAILQIGHRQTRNRGTIGGSLQTLVGGNITLFTQLCEKTRNEAFDMMLTHARDVGANAVVGVRYDATELMQGVTEVLCYGTAVVVAPDAGSPVPPPLP